MWRGGSWSQGSGREGGMGDGGWGLGSRMGPCSASRVISRAPGLKLVVETLISSLRPIGNIVLICCAFFIIFGILGVQVRTLLARGCPSRGTVVCGQQQPCSPRRAVRGGSGGLMGPPP